MLSLNTHQITYLQRNLLTTVWTRGSFSGSQARSFASYHNTCMMCSGKKGMPTMHEPSHMCSLSKRLFLLQLLNIPNFQQQKFYKSSIWCHSLGWSARQLVEAQLHRIPFKFISDYQFMCLSFLSRDSPLSPPYEDRKFLIH